MLNVPVSEIIEIRAPLLHCVLSYDQQQKNLFDVYAAFIPLRPFHDSLQGIQFPFLEQHIIWFISKHIISQIFENKGMPTSCSESSKTNETIEKLVSTRNSFPKCSKLSLRRFCVPVKVHKGRCSSSFGYITTYSKGSHEMKYMIKELRVRQIKEAL